MYYSIECEECEGELVLDEELTISFYYDDKPFKVKETGEIIEDTLNTHLTYRCLDCEKLFHYTYKEWERKFREKLAKFVTRTKKMAAFKNMDPKEIMQDRGLSFCGVCEGYDRAGNCFNDVIERCDIRKGKL